MRGEGGTRPRARYGARYTAVSAEAGAIRGQHVFCGHRHPSWRAASGCAERMAAITRRSWHVARELVIASPAAYPEEANGEGVSA